MQTPIYIVNHPKTFDTHEYQVEQSDKKLGKQAENLKILSEAVAAFQKDLKLIGKSDKVTGMTFSEFGRRIKSNGSLGTDHGAGAPIMFFGNNLNVEASNIAGSAYPVSGMIGKSPDLPDNAEVDDQVPMQFDFRQVYTTIMQDWLCMSEAEATDVLGARFQKLPIFKTKPIIEPIENNRFVIYPNPIIDNQVNIRFPNLISTNIPIVISDIQGVKILDDNYLINGDTLTFKISEYVSSGTYIIKLTLFDKTYVRKLIVT